MGGGDYTTRFEPTGPFFARFFITIILGLVAGFAFMGRSTRLVMSFVARRRRGQQISSAGEVPAWMFDRTACPEAEVLAARPFVGVTALAALSALFDLALKDRTPSAALLSGTSTPSLGEIENVTRQAGMPGSGYRHNRQPQPQMDLFGSGLSNGAIGAPAWPELPAEAREALTSLMTQLILDHAAMTATPPARRSIMIFDKIRPHHLEPIFYVRQSSALAP